MSIIFFIGCSDNYISQISNKEILESKIKCMRLIVFPPKDSIENSLNELYTFSNDCELKLIVSYKDSITCNSNQNSHIKARGMAKSYLRLELKKKNELMYSYYKDLKDNLQNSDIQNAFHTMKQKLAF